MTIVFPRIVFRSSSVNASWASLSNSRLRCWRGDLNPTQLEVKKGMSRCSGFRMKSYLLGWIILLVWSRIWDSSFYRNPDDFHWLGNGSSPYNEIISLKLDCAIKSAMLSCRRSECDRIQVVVEVIKEEPDVELTEGPPNLLLYLRLFETQILDDKSDVSTILLQYEEKFVKQEIRWCLLKNAEKQIWPSHNR